MISRMSHDSYIWKHSPQTYIRFHDHNLSQLFNCISNYRLDLNVKWVWRNWPLKFNKASALKQSVFKEMMKIQYKGSKLYTFSGGWPLFYTYIDTYTYLCACVCLRVKKNPREVNLRRIIKAQWQWNDIILFVWQKMIIYVVLHLVE